MEPLEEIECLKIFPINFVKPAKFGKELENCSENITILKMLKANIFQSGYSENLGSPL